MNFLTDGYNAIRGDQGKPQSPSETIDKLCDRVMHSSMLEDRRGSVLGLKGLSKDYKLEIGTKGMPGLINVLKNDRMDVDIINATLETLNTLCTSDKKSKHGQDGDNDLGVMFTEIYVKDPKNVTILLDILEESDFYVRFHTVEFLCTLLLNMRDQLQDLGISRLIDLLDDRREIIRNEGLLLLIALTKSNAEIQKIVAFENAFEKLLGIIMNEGSTDGGIVVQDCLQLAQNLLRHNASNQNFFRENSCIQQLQFLLVKFVTNPETSAQVEVSLVHPSNNWDDNQKIRNTIAVLELIRTLIFNPTLDLAMAVHIPSQVRAQALLTVGDIIRGNRKSQDAFSSLTLTIPGGVASSPSPDTFASKRTPTATVDGSLHPRPAVLAIIQTSLSREDFAIRSGATYVLQSLVHENPDMQLVIASTFTAPPSENPEVVVERPQSAGSLIVDALLDWDSASSRKDPYRVWFASAIMSHIVSDNVRTKQMALALGFSEEGEDSVNLLHKLMYQLSVSVRDAGAGALGGGPDVRVLIGLLSFICVWLFEFPTGVKEFFMEGSNLQFLTEQIIQSSGVDYQVQGLAAFLLGICHEFNDDSDPTFNHASLQSLIQSRIGVDVFVGRFERLRESKHFQKANLYFESDEPVDKSGNQAVYFDRYLVELFKANGDSISKSAVTIKSKKPKKPLVDSIEKVELDICAAQNLSYEKKITELEELVKHLQTQLSSKEHYITEQTAQIALLGNGSTKGGEQINDASAKLLAIEAEQEDLLVCLAEQDLEVKALKEKLKGYGEVFEESGDELDHDE